MPKASDDSLFATGYRRDNNYILCSMGKAKWARYILWRPRERYTEKNGETRNEDKTVPNVRAVNIKELLFIVNLIYS